jgi:hypothetical protein
MPKIFLNILRDEFNLLLKTQARKVTYGLSARDQKITFDEGGAQPSIQSPASAW